MYDRLQTLQGTMTSVYLGNTDLEYSRIGLYTRRTHIILISWAAGRADKVVGGEDIGAYIKTFTVIIQRLGVMHNDLHVANILWNDRPRPPMFIEFEDATAIPREALQDLFNNPKRKRSREKKEAMTGKTATRGSGGPVFVIAHGVDEKISWIDARIRQVPSRVLKPWSRCK